MPFRNDGEGLHRSVDPADGQHYVYGMSFMDAAPTIFACFDQPDLKAPYTFHVRAPADWVVDRQRARRAGRARACWEFEQTPAAVDVLRHPRRRALPRDPRRARRHPARPQRPGQHRGRPRQGRRRAVHADQAVLRRAPPAVRDPLPVRRLPPGVRAGVQRRRDGEPGLRDLPRPARLHQPGDPRASASPGPARSRTRWRTSGSATSSPRRGGTTCGSTSRSPSTWATGSPPTSPSTPTSGSTTPTRAASGGWSPTSGRAPTRSPATARSTRSAALQDFDGISYAKGCAILRQLNATVGDEVFFDGHHRPLRAAPLRQRHDARPVRELGARRGRRPVELHRQLAAHRRPGPDRARPRRGRRPAYAARRPPRRPAAHDPRRGRGGRRHLDRPRRWTSRARRRRSTPATGRCCSTPTTTPGRCSIPDKLTMDALETPAARSRRTRELRAGVWSNIRSALHNAAVDPVDVLEVAVRSLPIEDTEDTARRTMAWVYRWVVPLQPDPAAALARLHAAALGQARRGRARLRASSSRRSGPPSARRPTRPSLRGVARPATCPRASPLDLDLRWRVAGPAGRRSAPSTAPSSTAQLEAEPTGGRPGAPRRARAPRCPTPEAKAWAWGCFTGETRRAQLRARGRGLGLVARRPGGAHRAVRRALLRRPARHRQGAQRLGARRGRRGLLPADLADRETLARAAGARSPTPTWTCPCGAGWSTRRTTSQRMLAVLEAYPRHDHCRPSQGRRPGPTVRTRVTSSAPRASGATRTGWPPRSRWRSGWPGRARRRAGSG